MSNGKPMTTITMRVDEALAEQVEQAAAKDRRPVSAFVRNLVADALAKPEQAPKSEIAA
jgi:predicted transcriptional regulator